MTPLEAILLGLIQGITEFLPISSSGHLKLIEALLGYQNLHHYILFDLICHLGTLVAILYIFANEIRNILFRNPKQMIPIIIGTLPLFPCLLILKQIKAIYNAPELLGLFFGITSLLLFLAMKYGHEKSSISRWRDPFVIGIFQALALMPGVSRSGSTIAAARLLGWGMHDAVTFSFLLAIPAVLGGATIETLQLITGSETTASLGLSIYAIGFFTSMISGVLSLKLLIKLAVKNQFMYFVWYTLILSIVTLIYFN